MVDTFIWLVFGALAQTTGLILGLSVVGKPLRDFAKQYIKLTCLLFPFYIILIPLKLSGHISQMETVILNYCYLVILLKLVLKKSFSRIILEIIIFLCLNLFGEFLVVTILYLLFNIQFSEYNNMRIFTLLVFLESLFFLTLYIFIPIRGYLDRNEQILFKYILFFLNIFIYFLILSNLTKELKSNPSVFFIMTFLFIASLLTTFLTIIVFRGPREEIVLREQFEEFEKTLGPVLDELHTIQNDFKHHLKTLNELCATLKKESNLVQEVKKYELEAPKTLGGIENSLRLSNKVLEAIIYCKFQEAKAKKIDLRFEIPDKEIEFPLKNYEYTTVIANLLDNAYEAVEKNEEVEKDRAGIKGKVFFELGRQKQQSYIEVRNTGSIQEATIPNLFKKGYSTKKEKLGRKRGLGLYNVKKIVDKYKGNIEVHNWHDEVVFRVSF